MAARLGHRPELDGLRGIAVLLVMLSHAGVPGFRLGGLAGVEVFFVLSGFLITTRLLEDDGVDLRRFYVRRARRLLPALGALLVVLGVWAGVVGEGDTLAGVGAGAAYVANLARAQSIDLGVLNHLWSLAVEEHFYLLWPLVVIGCRQRARLVGLVAALGFLVSWLWRYELAAGGASWDRVYNGTDTRITGILAGALLAVLVGYGLRAPVVWPGMVGLVGLLWWWDLPASEPFRFGFVAVDLATAVVIVGAMSSRSRVLSTRPLVWVGSVSYAAYLWHVPIMDAVGDLYRLAWWQTGAAMLLTGAVSWASMRWVERRWMSGHSVADHDQAAAARTGRFRPGSRPTATATA